MVENFFQVHLGLFCKHEPVTRSNPGRDFAFHFRVRFFCVRFFISTRTAARSVRTTPKKQSRPKEHCWSSMLESHNSDRTFLSRPRARGNFIAQRVSQIALAIQHFDATRKP